MTTVVTPQSSDSSSGLLMGIVFLAIIVFVVLFFGGPIVRNFRGTGTQVNVPDKIDVNVNQGQ